MTQSARGGLRLVVLDTGMLVAGLCWRNEPHRCLQAWQQGLYQLAVSDAVFDEYRRVARRVKEQEWLPGDPEPFFPVDSRARGATENILFLGRVITPCAGGHGCEEGQRATRS